MVAMILKYGAIVPLRSWFNEQNTNIKFLQNL